MLAKPLAACTQAHQEGGVAGASAPGPGGSNLKGPFAHPPKKI